MEFDLGGITWLIFSFRFRTVKKFTASTLLPVLLGCRIPCRFPEPLSRCWCLRW